MNLSIPEDLSIPEFLLVENRPDLTPANRAPIKDTSRSPAMSRAPEPTPQAIVAQPAPEGVTEEPTMNATTQTATDQPSAKLQPSTAATRREPGAKPLRAAKPTPTKPDLKATTKGAEKAKGAAKPAPAATPAPAKDKPATASATAADKAHKGAFTPAICTLLVGMMQAKGGATPDALIKAARWGSCPNPARRLARFVSTVMERDMKLKVKVAGEGDAQTYSV